MTMASIPDPKEYHISEKYGFLLENPLDTLPEYFNPWNRLCQNMVDLLENNRLRDVVDKMPLLDHKRLEGYRQHHLGFLILANTSNCYILQNAGHDGVKKVLPRQIAIPLYALSTYLGLKPLLNWNSTASSNYKLLDPNGPLAAENMEFIMALPGGKSMSWMLLLSVQIEHMGVPAVFAIPEMLHACVDKDEGKVVKHLTFIKETIAAMTKVMPRFHEHMDTEELVTKGIPYFKQWGGEFSPLPDGLIFEGVEENKPLKFSKASSAAGTGVPKVLDTVLNIRHTADNAGYLSGFYDYMLPAHREFLMALRKAPSLYDYVHSNQNNTLLLEAYNACVHGLADFRSNHLQLVSKYMVTGLTKYHHTSPLLSCELNAPLMKILKGCRDSTADAQITA